jgi:hypothetical protein
MLSERHQSIERLLPPDCFSTRSTYCRAMSWKISDAPHELCIFSVFACARDTCGMATVAAAAPVTVAAPARNLRRPTFFGASSVFADTSCWDFSDMPKPSFTVFPARRLPRAQVRFVRDLESRTDRLSFSRGSIAASSNAAQRVLIIYERNVSVAINENR